MDNGGNAAWPDWFPVVLGIAFIVGGVRAFVSGHTLADYRDRCGLIHTVDIDGEQNPIQFLARVLIALLVGTALVSYGVYRMIGLVG